MKQVKSKYMFKTYLYLALFILALCLIFFAVYWDRSVILLIGFILLALTISGFLYYNGICYLSLASKKQEVVLETNIDCKNYFLKKKEKKEKMDLLFEKIFRYALCISPFVMAICIALGVFLLDSVLLSLVIPAILLVLCLVIFFIKEFYFESAVDDEEVFLKQVVVINKHIIYYNGRCYIYRGYGFDCVNNVQRFLKIKINTLHIKEENIARKFEDVLNEVRN